MKISVSNIAWEVQNDEKIYKYLKGKCDAIEIAPTRIVKDSPYDHVKDAQKIVERIQKEYGLTVCSMQSIWYGIKNNIFVEDEQPFLIKYTKKCIDFAAAINCHNIVFGCPKNRIVGDTSDFMEVAKDFFEVICDYATQKKVIIALEPNPKIYGTDFINTTEEAINFVKYVNNDSLKVNVDFGTIINNDENIDMIIDNIEYVNHIHISEPFLKPIVRREIHGTFIEKLNKKGYNGYISIEMANNPQLLIESLDYLLEVINEKKC